MQKEKEGLFSDRKTTISHSLNRGPLEITPTVPLIYYS